MLLSPEEAMLRLSSLKASIASVHAQLNAIVTDIGEQWAALQQTPGVRGGADDPASAAAKSDAPATATEASDVSSLQPLSPKSACKLKINVGGQVFTVSKSTLLVEEDSFFAAMLHGGHWAPDSDGEYFVDRSPEFFTHIINYLRDGRLDGHLDVDVDGLNAVQKRRLREDIRYLQLRSLSHYLLDGVCARTLEGHGCGVLCLAVAGDGDALYSGGRDNTMRLWDRDGRCGRSVAGHTDHVCAVLEWGGRLCTASADRTIKLWDRDYQCARTLTGHTAPVCCLAVWAGALWSGSSDSTIRAWDAEGRCTRTVAGHTQHVWGLLGARDALWSCSGDRSIKKWDRDGNCLATLAGHGYGVLALTMWGRTLCSGSSDNTIKQWDPESGACLRTLCGHTFWVCCLVVFEDFLWSGSRDHTIRQWDRQGACLRTLTDHSAAILALVVWNDELYSASADNTIKVWV